jgi:hypothetical protein
MDTLTILALGFINLACFLMGAKVGQTVSKGEEVKLPTVNPVEVYRKHEAKKEAQMEQERIDTIMRNIECFDGTGRGQEDVPGR